MRRWVGLAACAVLGTACKFDASGSGKANADTASGGATSTESETSGLGSGPGGTTVGDDGSAGTTTPSTSTTDASGGTGDATGPGTSGGSADEWWDPDYAQRIPLRIDEAADGPLPAGYTVVLSGYDWAARIDAGELLDRGQDLRIVRHLRGGTEELHRRALRLGNPTASEIWFKTVDDIDGASGQYYAYFDNPEATNPLQSWSDSMDGTSEVYLAADNFQEHQLGDCPDGWGDCGNTWSIAEDGQNRYVLSTGDGQYLLAGDDTWEDVWVEARVASLDPGGCPGIASHVLDANTLLYAGYGCDNATVPLNTISAWIRSSGYTPIIWGDQPMAAEQWFRVATAWTGDTVRLFHAGQLVGSANAPTAQPAGRAGLFSTYGTVLWADDVIVRRYVDPEPTVTALAVETYD